MEAVRSYLLSVTVAAIICGIITGFVNKKATTGKVLGLLTGLFMTCCVIAPIIDIDSIDFSIFDSSFTEDAQIAALEGELLAEEARQRIIIQNTASYILDKASSLGVDVEVEVTLDGKTSLPVEVRIDGEVSPYAKSVLSNYMEDTLDIAKGNQKWT